MAWNASSDTNVNVVGYFLYYGTASGTYSFKINAGGSTTATVTNLTSGTTYFFAATAYDATGDESLPSNEISYAVPANNPLVLTSITNQNIAFEQSLCITNSAVDQTHSSAGLTFSLDPGAPDGMSINPTNGVLSWSPTWAQAGTTNIVTVRVSNNSVPPLTATQTFTVVVGNAVQVGLGPSAVSVSQPGGSTVTFASSCAVTNLGFLLDAPAGWVGNMTVESLVPQSVVVSQYPPGAMHSAITLQTINGQSLPAGQPLARVYFTAAGQMPSAFGWINASNVTALQADGQFVPTAIGGGAQLVFVGLESLLEARVDPNGQRDLVLYGLTGDSYVVESTTNLNRAQGWNGEFSATMNSISQIFFNVSPNEPMKFYRARRLKQSAPPVTAPLLPKS